MRTLRAWLIRFGGLFDKRRFEQEIGDEIESNLQFHIDDGLRDGMNPQEARRQALIRLGGIEPAKEAWRDRRGIPFLESLWKDVVYAFWMMGRNKGWTAAATLSLALGIGANTALLNVVNSLLIENLPVENPDELVAFRWGGEESPGSGSMTYGYVAPDPTIGPMSASFSRAAFEAFQRSNNTLSDLIAFAPGPRLNLIVDGRADIAESQYVSGSYYTSLGVNAIQGRTIVDSDDDTASSPVIVLSEEYWTRRFGMDTAVIGKTVAINGVAATIVGIQPASIGDMHRIVAEGPDLYMPLALERQLGRTFMNVGPDWWLLIMGRRAPGATMDRIEGNFQGVFEQVARTRREAVADTNYRLRVTPGSRGIFDTNRTRGIQLAIPAVVFGILLLIVCVNMANLFLLRNEARQGELSIRTALGAARSRLIRQLLTESLFVAFLGGTASIAVAYLAHGVFVPSFGTTLDARATVLFAAALSLATGVVFGLIPAVKAGKEGSGIHGERTTRFRPSLGRALLIVQVSLSLVLLVVAGLFIGTLTRLQNVDPGLNADNVLLFDIEPRFGPYDDTKAAQVYAQFIERLSAVPGVKSASFSNGAPLSGSSSSVSIYVERPAGSMSSGDHAVRGVVAAPGYFETMGIPLMAGRNLTAEDGPAGRQVAVVNREFARLFLPGGNPIGQRFFRSTDNSGPLVEIVGVVSDTHHLTLRQGVIPVVYRPVSQEQGFSFSGGRRTFAVRTETSPETIIPSLRQIAGQIDPNLPLLNITTLRTHLERNWSRERTFALLSGFFGSIALLVSMIGLFGVMSYTVTRRTKEFGIRMAFGADRGGILQSVLRESLAIVISGVVLGLGAALVTTRFLATMLFGLEPNDPATILAAVGGMLVVSAVAAYLPARRASRVNPLIALRHE